MKYRFRASTIYGNYFYFIFLYLWFLDERFPKLFPSRWQRRWSHDNLNHQGKKRFKKKWENGMNFRHLRADKNFKNKDGRVACWIIAALCDQSKCRHKSSPCRLIHYEFHFEINVSIEKGSFIIAQELRTSFILFKRCNALILYRYFYDLSIYANDILRKCMLHSLNCYRNTKFWRNFAVAPHWFQNL